MTARRCKSNWRGPWEEPGAEDALLSAESDTEAFYGRFDRARSLTKRAAQSAKNADMAETAAGWMANAALREAEVGNKVQARAIAAESAGNESRQRCRGPDCTGLGPGRTS